MKDNNISPILFIILCTIILYFGFWMGTLVNQSEEITIIRVIDGDTIMTDEGKIIRILGIDTPEKNGLRYSWAKERMEDLVLNSKVMLECEGKDEYGRRLCWVYINVIQIMIREGHSKYVSPY